MEFAKYHALGNDYLVIEAGALGAPLAPAQARLLCDRHRGIGSDGILLREPGPSHRLRIVNPDGSEAEKSGNGLRIFARYLFDRGVVAGGPFEVETAGGTVTCRVLGDGRSVSVDMGPVRFDSATIPVAGPPREVLREPIRVAGLDLEFSAASVGNPHCVVLRETVSAEEVQRLGPLLERDPRFPRRTNVQLVQVLDPGRLRVEVWERGAGYTLASGSSACAAAAVTHRLGRTGAKVAVEMAGGSLEVELSPDFRARLTGGVTKIAEGRVASEMWTGGP